MAFQPHIFISTNRYSLDQNRDLFEYIAVSLITMSVSFRGRVVADTNDSLSEIIIMPAAVNVNAMNIATITVFGRNPHSFFIG